MSDARRRLLGRRSWCLGADQNPFGQERSGRVVDQHHVPVIDPSARRPQDLLHAWRQGDSRAGHELFSRLRRRLVRYFRRAGRTHADDLAQETLAAFVRVQDTLQDDRALLGFLFTVARRTLAHDLERDSRRPIHSDEAAIDEASVDPRHDRHVDAHRMIDHLRVQPPLYADALAQYFLEGRRGPEIAARLEICPNTVHSRIQRGLVRLRRCAV